MEVSLIFSFVWYDPHKLYRGLTKDIDNWSVLMVKNPIAASYCTDYIALCTALAKKSIAVDQ